MGVYFIKQMKKSWPLHQSMYVTKIITKVALGIESVTRKVSTTKQPDKIAETYEKVSHRFNLRWNLQPCLAKISIDNNRLKFFEGRLKLNTHFVPNYVLEWRE